MCPVAETYESWYSMCGSLPSSNVKYTGGVAYSGYTVNGIRRKTCYTSSTQIQFSKDLPAVTKTATLYKATKVAKKQFTVISSDDETKKNCLFGQFCDSFPDIEPTYNMAI